MNNYFFYAVIIMIFVLSGCQNKIDSQLSFENNKHVYSSIIQDLHNAIEIVGIEPGMDIKYVDNFEQFTDKTVNVYKNVESLLGEIGVRRISVVHGVMEGKIYIIMISFIMPLKYFDWSELESINFFRGADDVVSFMPPGAECLLISDVSWYLCKY